jgi:hypothetical protein
MFPNLKIAFCISGEPRQYKNCSKYLLEYIEDFKFNLLKSKKWNTVIVDIFIHSWNSISTQKNNDVASKKMLWDLKQHKTYDIEELRKDLIKKYNPKRILVESKDVMDDLYQYYSKWMPSNVEVEDLKDSNYLALMQHISGERAAYLKSGVDIICQGEDIVGDVVSNDYDIAIKTRTDVFCSVLDSNAVKIFNDILNFEGKERTPNGMTYFSTVNLRNGNVAVQIAHWWSNNKQFDMIHDKLVEKLLSYKEMPASEGGIIPLRDTCHHDMIGYHMQKIGISVREWGGKGIIQDYTLFVVNTPSDIKDIPTIKKYTRIYETEHLNRLRRVEG